ncbi:chemotaxis protein CheB [Daejeonella lutea]|uniref:histidine kinase n=1 Tax=Daejeonella lutea TaxID=572036 RepID=A0A1T5A4Y2_9SPHI|nr:chemotaxis protein CheB [Daejeonella lutea]SKB29683.1 two-component system, chemotaxis family, CheB/CheR fusion protein [Daejeonella lutea]
MKTTRRYSKYIVGIGASAGGLEAIHEFFDHMPASSNFSFVIIQHLSTDYKSLLVELVSKHTHMKVFEAQDNMTIQQDCVYIIPNNKLMTVSHGKLKLSMRSDVKSPNTAIDIFLNSLGRDQKDKSIAIILSGTGTDGTKGIEVIKECGGMVMVQEPSSAKFDGMPNSAITSGNADHILVPKEMPDQLFKFVNEEPINIMKDGKIDEEQLDEIFRLVYRENGHDFNLYKTPTIVRRITRRMNDRNVRELPDYITILKGDSEEVKLLGNDFLIGVTRFFRDKQAFAILESKIIPEILSGKEDGSVLKVWVCACSTGEEAYSVAITVNKCVEISGKNIEIKIFATDVDGASLDIASANRFPLNISEDVPADILKKYFNREHKHYSVIPSIRKQIVFAKHDVIKSPPFIKNDLVTCRNMLIYMNSILQTKILSTFHFSLSAGGYLFLGPSETGSLLKDGFVEVSSKWKFYKKSGLINYSSLNSYQVEERIRSLPLQRKDSPKSIGSNSSVENDFKSFLMADLGYAGIYIDNNHVIRDVVGNYKKFLSLPDDQIELNVLKMVPKTVAVLLNTGIRRAQKERKTVHLHNLVLDKSKKGQQFNVSIRKPESDDLHGYTLLAFSESFMDYPASEELKSIPEDSRHNEFILELEAELSETRTNLQMAVEEMETTNEELQSSNEELLSANEELQSSNEELQSLNEELHTLNTEHQMKIKELVDLNDDLDNYFKAIDTGFIFLNTNLTIRKFNPAVIDMVNLIEADIGRSFEHISNNVLNENLTAEIHMVMANGKPMQKEVELKNGLRCLMKVMPYVRKDKQIDGVIISFVDITELAELSNIVTSVLNASNSGIFAFASLRNRTGKVTDFQCISCNYSAAELMETTKERLEGASMLEHMSQLTQAKLFDRYAEVANGGSEYKTELVINSKWYQLVAVRMGDGLVLNLTDTTATKSAEQRLRKNYNDLIDAREKLKSLNLELEDRITERTKELSESEERFKLVSTATNDTIWDWDLASNSIWRNENYELMFGYKVDEQSKKPAFWFETIHEDDRDRIKESVYSAINKKSDQWSEQYRFRKANGDYAFVLDRGRILKDEYNTPFRVVGSTIDITQLIETEQKLAQSQGKFRKIFESNVIGMTFASLKTGEIFEANQAFLHMVGYTIEELKASPKIWTQLTPPEFHDVTRKAIEEVGSTGSSVPFQKQFIRKNGEAFWVLAGSAILDEKEGDEVVTFIIDINAQKESEKKKNDLQQLIIKQKDQFYSMFQHAPALITIRSGEELRYQYVNDAFRTFDGQEHYIGKTAREAGSEFADSEIEEISLNVLKTGVPYTSNSVKVSRKEKNGDPKDSWYDFTITPVFSDEGEIDGVAFFGFDVTDLVLGKQAVQELMQRKDEFLSIASHELKTPITSIKLSLQIANRLLKSEKPVEHLEQFIIKATRQGDRLNQLVQDLLDVTRIQGGKMLFNYSTFDSENLIIECVEDVEEESQTHQIKIIKNVSASITADMSRIGQVVVNFLSNAIKYSPEATEVEVYSEVVGDRFKLSVKDFGIGIPDDKQQRIFDRFYRVQESSVKFSGLGLGLYISAEIIRRHNGTIGVNSIENEGSEFWFEIPLNTEKQL